MATLSLGINTGFALNRYTAPEQWIPLVTDEFGLSEVQFTADLLNPSWSTSLIRKELKKITELKARHHLHITSTFTSAFTRVNHLAHPDKAFRDYWIDWFKKWIDISLALGATSTGSHLGILTAPDYENNAVRKERFEQVIDGWMTLAAYAKEQGLAYLTWEPMSIGREFGETIAQAHHIHTCLNQHSAVPIYYCLDVDHGDVMSPNPNDTDPYQWLAACANQSPLIHIKQSTSNKSGHHPFTEPFNQQGRIHPRNVLPYLVKSPLKHITLLLELSFRERNPADQSVVQDIKASVDYWKPFLKELKGVVSR